jgi:uncharacterized protein
VFEALVRKRPVLWEDVRSNVTSNEYKWYFRCLETRDEYFEYYRRRHAFWRIYGFQVPDEVLKKVYYKNALRLVPGIHAKEFPE